MAFTSSAGTWLKILATAAAGFALGLALVLVAYEGERRRNRRLRYELSVTRLARGVDQVHRTER